MLNGFLDSERADCSGQGYSLLLSKFLCALARSEKQKTLLLPPLVWSAMTFLTGCETRFQTGVQHQAQALRKSSDLSSALI